MSSTAPIGPDGPRPGAPLIALVHSADRAFGDEMAREAARRGYPGARPAHNAVFATLSREGDRASDMAQRAGITKQSMGEVVRELVGMGLLEVKPDPADRRAKLVTYTEEGLAQALAGRQHLMDLEQRFAEEVGAEDFATARRVLVKVTEILRERAAAADDDSGEALGA